MRTHCHACASALTACTRACICVARCHHSHTGKLLQQTHEIRTIINVLIAHVLVTLQRAIYINHWWPTQRAALPQPCTEVTAETVVKQCKKPCHPAHPGNAVMHTHLPSTRSVYILAYMRLYHKSTQSAPKTNKSPPASTCHSCSNCN